MTTVNIATAKQNLITLANSCIKFNERICVSTKDGNFIMLSEKDYNNLLESLYLAGIPGMYESIQEGLNTPPSECANLKLN